MTWLIAIGCLLAGGTLGALAMALAVMAGKSDPPQRDEEIHNAAFAALTIREGDER